MKFVLPLLTASLFVNQSEAKQPVTVPPKPNFVIIYGDDIGYGDFSCYGAKKVSTPNVDKLSREGIRFTNAHSAASTCTPSRYALISGEYAWRRADTGIAQGDASMIISPDRYTIADVFKTAGYSTGIVGKWHLGLGNTAGKQNWNGLVTPGPNDLGFDYSYIMAATLDRVPCVFLENGRVVNLDPNDPITISYKLPIPGEPTGKDNPDILTVLRPSYGHDQAIVNGVSRIGYMKGGKSACWKDENFADTITRKAIQFIEKKKDQPFFLYFATGDIHVPRVPHPRFVGKTGMGARGDAILSFDASVGEIVKTLSRLGLMENTIIILSSDNGAVIDDGYQDKAAELLGNHTPWNNFRGAKGSMFEGGTRVPCIIRWKNVIKPQISDALLCQIDWFASFANMLKVNLPAGAAPDSEELFQSWIGQNRKGRDYFVEQNNNPRPLAICTDEWKYIPPYQGTAWIKQTNSETGFSDKPQLYNLRKDIGERNNLADQYPEILNKLSQRLKLIQTRKPLVDIDSTIKVAPAHSTVLKNANEQLLYFTSTSLLNDDRHLIFLSDRTGNPNIFMRDLKTGKERQLSNNKKGYLKSYVYFDGQPYKGLGKASISVDPLNGLVYYLEERKIMVVDTTGKQRILAEYPEGQMTAFTHVSGDGSRICIPTTDARALDGDQILTGKPKYDIDQRVRYENLNSYLRIFDTKTGKEICCERVPKAWITHVQFSPINKNLILYNHEWPSDCGIQRMWLWDGNSHLPLRDEGEGRKRGDWTCHEMWQRDGKAIIYHGEYLNGPAYIGRIYPDGSGRIEIPLPNGWKRYGHFTEGATDLMVTDGYYTQPDDKLIQNASDSGLWICLLKVNWDQRLIKWIPLCRNGSSWRSQDEHPHPIFNHASNSVFFTSDMDGERSVYQIVIDEK